MRNALDKNIAQLLLLLAAPAMLVAASGCSADDPPISILSHAGDARSPAEVSPDRRSAPMPAGLRAAYIASVQAHASDAYRWQAAQPPVLRASNAAEGFSAEITPAGVHIHAAGTTEPATVSMVLSGAGCADRMAVPAAALAEVSGNRVDYRRGDLLEWYVNGPLGLEQGFTLLQAPACRSEGGGEPTLAITLGGTLTARLSAAGDAVELRDSAGVIRLRYSDLYVHDSTGRALRAGLFASAGMLSIHWDDAGAVYPVVIDPLIGVEQNKLTASDGVLDDGFGTSAAIDADTAIIGALQQDTQGIDAGAAYVFVRNGAMWTEQAKLIASDGANGDNFGVSVALSADTAIVGADKSDAMGIDSGTAYVFVRSGTQWTEQAKLVASDAVGSENFGRVALAGDTAVIGAFNDDDLGAASGSAYVFVRNGTQWSEQAKLTAADGASGDQLGVSVALSGDTALVGALHDSDQGMSSGSAYAFVRNGVTWTEQAKLRASDGADGDEFGVSVALSGDTAVIGAPRNDHPGSDEGAAYVFVRSGSTWTEQTKLTAADGAMGDGFGGAVALSGDTAVVAAGGDDDKGQGSGSAYVFVRSGNLWSEEAKLTASDGAMGDGFGSAVALAGDTALVTALRSGLGAGYPFVLRQDTGDTCAAAAECATGNCVDGVCCDTACGGGVPSDCLACSVASGAAVDGTCAPIAAGITCRAAFGTCDVAEACNGTDAACPADVVAPDGTECRAAGGDCDVAETCDGSSKMCPPNVVVAAGTECRPADGLCDVAEICDGSNLGCPADALAAAGTECRAVAGACDVAEQCDGKKRDCPADTFMPDGTACPEGACTAGGKCMPDTAAEDESGCGCRVVGKPSALGQRHQAPGVAALGLLVLAALRLASRRRSG